MHYNSVLTYSHLFSCCGHSYSLFAVVYLARQFTDFYIVHTTVSVMPKMMVCSLDFLFFIHIIEGKFEDFKRF